MTVSHVDVRRWLSLASDAVMGDRHRPAIVLDVLSLRKSWARQAERPYDDVAIRYVFSSRDVGGTTEG